MTPTIPILSWDPDGMPTMPGTLVDVLNMVPTRRSYAADIELAAPLGWGVGLELECYGAGGLEFLNGNQATFIASGNNLFYTTGTSLINCSRTASVYVQASQGGAWVFEAFQDVALASSEGNTLQATASYATTKFSDVSGAPKAGTLAVQRNFVLAGNNTFGSSVVPDGWACSALEDYTNWTPDIATQAARGRLTATPGKILRLIAYRDSVIAFKKRGVYRGQYVGAAANTWSFPLIDSEIGIIARDAVCEAEGALYWMGQDGFYRYGGGNIERIANAPWGWLRANMTGAITIGMVHAVYDPIRRVVRWFIHAARSGFAGPFCLTYHVDTGKWGRSDLRVAWAFRLPFAQVPSQENTSNFDSTRIPGYVHNSSLLLVAHAGTAMTSSATTGDIGDGDQQFLLTGVRAQFVTAPTTSQATHLYRQDLDGALQTGATVGRINGKFDFSHSARWHRIRFEQTGMCELSGISVEVPQAGRR